MQNIEKLFRLSKRLLLPLKSDKKASILYILSSIYDSAYIIFLIQIWASIIAAIEQSDTHLFYKNIILLGILQILLIIKNRVGSRSGTHLNIYLRTFLNKNYLKKYIDADNNKIEILWTWRMNNIIFTWVNRWVQILIHGLLPAISGLFAIIYGFIIIGISVNFSVFLLFLSIFLVGIFIIVMSFVKSAKWRKLAKTIDITLDRWKIKILMSKFEIFQNNKFKVESKYLDKLSDELFSTWWHHSIIRLQWEGWYQLLSTIWSIILYLIFGLGIISGEYSISYLVLLIGLFGRVTNYVYWIKMYTKEIARSIVHVEKLRDVMDNIPQIENSKNLKKFVLSHWDIKLDNIYFSYWETEQVFRNFNLHIKWWKKTALVGESWSGKSTLIKVIAGYLRIEKWKILVDGQNLKEISLQSYYKHIWYLTQEPSVFDWTIIDNLTYALKEKPNNAQLNKIIKASKCEFVYKFKDWLKTEIGERWIRLSGWQKQRLAIAKIMLKNPEIILLDEPTSALDSVSEQKVSDALHNLFHGRTVLVIAHRLQTVKESNDIIVLEKWKIIERWTHKQLEKENWVYKKMLDLQTTF